MKCPICDRDLSNHGRANHLMVHVREKKMKAYLTPSGTYGFELVDLDAKNERAIASLGAFTAAVRSARKKGIL